MSNLPKSWVQVPITEVLEPNTNGKPFQQGWSPQCLSTPAPEGNWGVLKTTAIQHGEFWPHENKALPDILEPRPHLEVKPGDVLMTCAGPRNRCGVACLVEHTQQKLMMSGKMYRFRPHPDVMHAKYLMYFLLTYAVQLEVDRMKTGINDSGLNLTHNRFATLKVPLAPFQEQCRIVTKIEELFSELDKGIEVLATSREQIKVYRQAVLKHAFEGRFTSEIRATNDPVRISDAMSSKEIRDEELAPIPNQWKYVRLGHLVDHARPITYGVIKLGAEFDEGVPTLRSSDVRRLRIDLDSVKRISPEIAAEFSRTFLKGGEVLITVRGTLGGVAVVPTTLAGWNISREVAMIAPTDSLSPNYLQYMVASPQLDAWFKGNLRGVAYTGINLETLRDAPIALCGIEEQKMLVSRVEQILSVADVVESEISDLLAKGEVLRQSILKKAFSGQLGVQNPKDEPASVLLERIRAERKAANQQKPKRKTKKTKSGKEVAA